MYTVVWKKKKNAKATQRLRLYHAQGMDEGNDA